MLSMHRSKIDTWILVTFIALMAVSIAVGAKLLVARREPVVDVLISVFLGIIGIGMPLWTLLSTSYTITETSLLIRSGPFRWHIPLDSIRSITPSRSILSSPALSLDRLRVDYGAHKSVLVSPRDAQAFVADLEFARSHARAAEPAA